MSDAPVKVGLRIVRLKLDRPGKIRIRSGVVLQHGVGDAPVVVRLGVGGTHLYCRVEILDRVGGMAVSSGLKASVEVEFRVRFSAGRPFMSLRANSLFLAASAYCGFS